MAKFQRSSRLGKLKLTQARKKKAAQRYHLRNIQSLLSQGFNERELRDLCFYELEFRPVHDQIPQGAGKSELIRLLLEFAEQKLLLDTLLEWAQKRNPARYEQYRPYLIVPK
ncbi:MAG: hypothetical protein U0401_02655 [Anaerolineae bacterium]